MPLAMHWGPQLGPARLVLAVPAPQALVRGLLVAGLRLRLVLAPVFAAWAVSLPLLSALRRHLRACLGST